MTTHQDPFHCALCKDEIKHEMDELKKRSERWEATAKEKHDTPFYSDLFNRTVAQDEQIEKLKAEIERLKGPFLAAKRNLASKPKLTEQELSDLADVDNHLHPRQDGDLLTLEQQQREKLLAEEALGSKE